MNIKQITNKVEWDNFFNSANSPSFLQSWEWGDLQKEVGEDVLRIGIYDNNEIVGIAQIIKIKAKRGNFLFIPHGPIIEVESQKLKVKSYLDILLKYLIQLAKNEKYDFIRIAPIIENTEESRGLFKDLGFRTAPIYLHAERIWELPLDKSEDEILQGMRKTTRYLIKKAHRDGVVIEKRTDEKIVDDFWKLYEETAERENFHPFPKKFIQKEFEIFHASGNALFLFAYVHPGGGRTDSPGVLNTKEYLASALIIFTRSTGFYHQGASIHSKIPVTYAIQWEAIREAKKRGCKLYNFWGTLQPGRTPKNWGGLTLFKTGFGGHQIDYVLTQDYPISPKYYLTYLYEKFLSIRRGV